MNPHGRQQIVLLGQLQRGPAGSGGNGHAQDSLHPRGPRPTDHLVAISVELRLVQMAMGVEIHDLEGRNQNDEGMSKPQ